jgi:pyrroline-5-carboxylate reductase
MSISSLGIAGAGRMGSALLQGWAKARAHGFAPSIIVFEPHLSPDIEPALETLGAAVNPRAGGAPLDVLVLAVKPQTFGEAAPGLKPFVGPDTLVLSNMAGVTTARLKEELGAARAVRAMPNTPGAIGKGITAYAAPDALPAQAHAQIASLLAPLGAVEQVPDEAAIDSVTALSGSGPAYIFLLVEAMAAAGEAEGLERNLAMRLARATVAGSGALLDASPAISAEALRQAVTSPGGTTAAALNVLMAEDGLTELMKKAIRAAAARARELGA